MSGGISVRDVDVRIQCSHDPLSPGHRVCASQRMRRGSFPGGFGSYMEDIFKNGHGATFSSGCWNTLRFG